MLDYAAMLYAIYFATLSFTLLFLYDACHCHDYYCDYFAAAEIFSLIRRFSLMFRYLHSAFAIFASP